METARNMDSAKVTRIITGQGAQGLRDAIAYGMMDADIDQMAQETIRENDALRKSNLELCAKLRAQEQETAKWREQYRAEKRSQRALTASIVNGYKALVKEKHKAWRITALAVAACCGACAMMLATTITLFW